MNSDRISSVGVMLLFAAMLIGALVTGSAFNPLRGARPFLVKRSERPWAYWTSVVLNALGLAMIVFVEVQSGWP